MCPTSPKPRCRVCGQLHCTEPSHKARDPRQRDKRRLPRPDYNSHAQRSRRKAVVTAFLAEYGRQTQDGRTVAICPQCGQWRSKWVADHVVPFVVSGDENGELRVHCSVCSGRQGAWIATQLRLRG
jgi:hypothetical protein